MQGRREEQRRTLNIALPDEVVVFVPVVVFVLGLGYALCILCLSVGRCLLAQNHLTTYVSRISDKWY